MMTKKRVSFQLLLVALVAMPSSSWALFEMRATIGATQAKPNVQSVCHGSCTAPGSVAGAAYVPGIGVDAILKLPLIPVGFGLRYEGIQLKGDNLNSETEIKYSRTALLLNYRIIDTVVHFGPIASYGISHSGSMTITEGGVTRVDLSAHAAASYSVGLEVEIKPLIVVPLIVGAEAGYMGYRWSDAHNPIDNTKKDVDLSGTYIKLFLGLDI